MSAPGPRGGGEASRGPAPGGGGGGGGGGGEDQRDRRAVLEALAEAFARLAAERLGALVPEVRSNLGFALPGASGPDQVAAFPGRLTDLDGRLAAVAGPRFGASRHVAAVILAAGRRYPELRAAMNVRCDAGTLAACATAGLRLARFDRTAEPPAIKAREGSSLEWGTGLTLDRVAAAGQPAPDGVWDGGDLGKEPIIRLLGRDPAEVADKVLRLAAALAADPATRQGEGIEEGDLESG